MRAYVIAVALVGLVLAHSAAAQTTAATTYCGGAEGACLLNDDHCLQMSPEYACSSICAFERQAEPNCGEFAPLNNNLLACTSSVLSQEVRSGLRLSIKLFCKNGEWRNEKLSSHFDRVFESDLV